MLLFGVLLGSYLIDCKAVIEAVQNSYSIYSFAASITQCSIINTNKKTINHLIKNAICFTIITRGL